MVKIIRMFSKREYLVEDGEALGVERLKGNSKLVTLRSGEKINPNGIESITDPSHEKIATMDGYLFDEKNNSYVNDKGCKVYINDPNRLADIRYIENPKYSDKKLLK